MITRTANSGRWRRWSTRVSAALLVATLAFWITSLFGVIWAPTRRHKIDLLGGLLIVHIQKASMPSSLPADATKDDIAAVASLKPGDGLTQVDWKNITAKSKWAFYKPGLRIYWFFSIRPDAWLPKYSYSATIQRHTLFIPFYLPAILFSILPTSQLLRRTRAQPGHCRSCNYNLIGNTSGICPECGTATSENCTA